MFSVRLTCGFNKLMMVMMMIDCASMRKREMIDALRFDDDNR